ncbi:hypothetical protein [Actinoplanes sp. NPDC048796]|uniref:hypothetical protein n=1 Tax=Actinoplanes sp. NPDC048796 TaxID=3155640 RepID=UPI0033CC5283
MTIAVARSRLGRALSAAGRDSLYCLTLLPRSVAAVVTGRPRGRAAAFGYGVLSVLLGVAALVPLGVELLGVLRGLLYGLVDHGPYDNSWGGPTRAGAWLTHFAVGIPITAVAALALVGIAAVHRRLTAGLAGRPREPWVIPVAVLAPVPAIVFFIAWLHQI